MWCRWSILITAVVAAVFTVTLSEAKPKGSNKENGMEEHAEDGFLEPEGPPKEVPIADNSAHSFLHGKETGESIMKHDNAWDAMNADAFKIRHYHGQEEIERQLEEFEYNKWIKDAQDTKRLPPKDARVENAIKHGHTSEKKLEKLIEKSQGRKGKKEKVKEKKNRRKRSFIETGNNKWTKCVIPYNHDASLTNTSLASPEALENERNGGLWGMNKYMELTGFRFVPYTGNNSDYGLDHNNYLNFVYTSGCWSYVGNINGWEGQDISSCTGNTAVHELGHALGLWHENQHPRSMNYLRTKMHEVNDGSEYNFYRWSLKEGADINLNHYDVSSIMHYSAWAFNKNYEDTLQMYDEEDSVYFSYMDSNYYMFRDLQIYHDCFSQFPNCDIKPTCVNGGYVTIIGENCLCRCPTGLDPDTNCATELVQTTETSWPAGTYSFFKTTLSESCPTGFAEGTMVHWSDYIYDGWNAREFHSPAYDNYEVAHDVCTKTSEAGNGEWPAGTYCILKHGATCPSGFTEGTIQTYGQQRPADRFGENTGTLPAGNKSATNFEYIFCCREDQSPNTPLANFEIRDPIILFNIWWDCQAIEGTYHKREHMTWWNYNGVPMNRTGLLPKHYAWYGETLTYLYYCVYFPINKGNCGEIKTFSVRETNYHFTTPNYPNNYPLYRECTWRFESPPDTIMQIDFTDFEVPYDSDGNCFSSLEIRDWYPETAGHSFCGTDYKKTSWTKENYLTLKLITGYLTAHEGKGFNATIKIIPKDNMGCYKGDGSGGVYSGSVNYGKTFSPCLPWDQVTSCPFNQFDSRVVDEDLTGHNHCRNVGVGLQPWCYKTNDDCQRQSCDACQLGTCYDLFSNCADEISKDPDYCAKNAFGEAERGCRRTCGKCAASGSECTTCSAPGPVEGIIPSPMRDSYHVGDAVTYTCPDTGIRRTRTCSSEGTWTPMLKVCHACPTGWAVHNKKCYKWLGLDVEVPRDEAVSMCADLQPGARVPKILNMDEQQFLMNMIDYEPEDYGDFWFGVVKNSTGHWVWDDDGTVPSWSDWQWYFPWGGTWGGHDCGYIYDYWRSGYCTDSKYVICELQIPNVDSPSSCVDLRDDCATTLTTNPDMCTTYPDYAWHNCRHTCGIDVCMDTSITCNEGSTTIDHGEVLEISCYTGNFHTGGNLKRFCLPSGEFTGEAAICSPANETSSVTINKDIMLKRRHHNINADRIVIANNDFMKVPYNGKITSWSFYSNFVGLVAFYVLRPTGTIEPSYLGESFSIVGVTVINETADDRIMKYVMPAAQALSVQAGDFIGIYHRNNEMGRTMCYQPVQPEHSEWMVSDGYWETQDALPTTGSVTFTEPFYISELCRIYSLHYDINPE